MNTWIPLISRRVYKLLGHEAADLLQGISTNDMRLLRHQNGIFTVFLNRQGRFLADAFVFYHEGQLYLEYDISHDKIIQELFIKYGPLHTVQLQNMPWLVLSFSGPESEPLYKAVKAYVQERCGIMFRDPRHSHLGVRVVISYAHWHETPHPLCVPESETHYRTLCIENGIPSGAQDLISERTLILEYFYHFHHSISWSKGCYVGQEVLARTFHQKLFRKGLFRITHLQCSVVPKVGDAVFDTNGHVQGIWGKVCSGQGLLSLEESWALQWVNTQNFECRGDNGTVITGKLLSSITLPIACPQGV
ncbi:YgfZ/GcvT domain-containing protein [Holospora curviuscula]|uniref:Putative global regulator n=1 Tax=Holospora curviuscula TaxID=1082868 RepID=A0A2S5R861_9PROT|nr:hypothetical protein [Holospora curviuscula]PPE03477.1 putative global regulator [Holospora curviuscula]